MAKIFISYARKDKDEVYPIVDELERNGFDCWIDKNGIESGSVFKKVIISAINECEVFVYMFSKNAFDSEWVDKEYDQAKAKGKHIIPVMLKGAANNEDIMFDFRRIDYIDTCKEGWREKLIRELKKRVGIIRDNIESSFYHQKISQNNTQFFDKSTACKVDVALSTDKHFLMPVEDVFSITGRGTVATGRIETGAVKIGDEVQILGFGNSMRGVATGVEKYRKIQSEGKAGDYVGLILRGVKQEDIKRGMVICNPGQTNLYKSFKALVHFKKAEEGGFRKPILDNINLTFRIRTLEIKGVIKLEKGTEMILPGDASTIEVSLPYAIALNVGLELDIRQNYYSVGSGHITEILG